ncbi:MAG TPA: hypothetical protein VFN21_01550, partial [Acidimicrobiales bacterium]|nr:hypothetical protein [Acidimicrobiales bacterium]
LAGSETRHVVDAAERGVLRDYTIWAIALGEIDRWGPLARSAGVVRSAPGTEAILTLTARAESDHVARHADRRAGRQAGRNGGRDGHR